MRVGSSLVAFIVCCGLAASVHAQPSPGGSGTSTSGIPVGPFLFRPSFGVGWEWRDNLFYGTTGTPTSGSVFHGDADLALVLPLSRLTVELDYRPNYQNYENYELSRKWSHNVALRGSFAFPIGLTLKLGYNYQKASTNVREVDPGGEIAWSDDPFTRNSMTADASYWLTNRDGLSVRGSWNDLTYANPERAAFYNNRRSSFGAGWLHQVSPNAVLRIGYDHGRFEPEQTLSARGYMSDTVSVSLNGKLGSGFSSDLEVGWKKLDFNLLPEDPELKNTSGWVVSGGLGYTLAHGGQLNFTAGRDWNPSNYSSALGYRSDRLGLVYRLDLVRIGFDVGGNVGRNVYGGFPDDPSTGRRDQLLLLHAGLNFGIREGLSSRVEYRYQDRTSNAGFAYTVNSVLVSLGLSLGEGR